MAKIQGKHFDKLKVALNEVIERSDFASFQEVAEYYIQNQIGKRDQKMRARWDIFWGIKSELRNEILDEIKKDVGDINDAHIDTALKRITGIA